MKRQNVFFSMILCLFFSFSYSQIDNSVFNNNYHIPPSDSQKLFFRIENTDFLKNNEYFNDYYVGFTLFGYFLKPKFVYYPSANTKIEAGAFLLKYSGLDDYSKVTPLLTFQYNYHDWFNLVFGTINGAYNHHLLEPLFEEDRYYQDQVENGLQLLFDFRHFKSDVWVAWEKFIFPGDPFKEQIFGGISAKVILTNPESKFKLEVPLQGMVKHYGGQIDAAEIPMSSLANTASGLVAEYKTGKFVKSVGIDGYLTTFNNITEDSDLPYLSGYGILSDIYVKTKLADLYLGYWNAENFLAPKGEPHFQSYPMKDSSSYVNNREVVTIKLDIGRKLAKDIFLKLRFEGYYDVIQKNFDYSYGLNVVFNSSFFIKKF